MPKSPYLRPRWTGGGERIFESGRRFLLKSVSFWGGESAFETENGNEVVNLEGPRGLFHNEARAGLGFDAEAYPETPILLLLIWYLRLLMREDTEGTTPAVAA